MQRNQTTPRDTALELLASLRAHDYWTERMQLLAAEDGRERFLAHVARAVPYYQRLFGSGQPPSSDDFPLTGRAERVLGRAEFRAEPPEGAPPLLPRTTSGTTGTPLTVLLDQPTFFHINDAIYGEYADIHRVRDALRPGEVGITLVTNKPHQLRTEVPVISLHGASFRRLVVGRSAEEDAAAVSELRAAPPPMLYGKPTYLLDLAEVEERLDGTPRIRPLTLITAGENLFPDDRRRLEEWFGCAVLDSYASTEGGLVASECPHRCGLHLRGDRVELEVLGDDGRLAREGTGELVLTNKLNWGMPFVHYRTGDCGTLREAACACGYSGPSLVEFPGREARWFRTPREERFDPRRLEPLFTALPVRGFQVVQRGDARFLVRFVAAGPAAEIDLPLRESLRRQLGEVELELEAVPRLVGPGGKCRRFAVEAP
ncbi:MAG TPA: AMP-binding protein [Longimicrobiaceae bacterium]|nr:AMP-binding protein [Longimicrobiaceae bacterium]